MRMNKAVSGIVLALIICMPLTCAETAGLSDVAGSQWLNTLDMESYLLGGGIDWKNIGTYKGDYCIKDMPPAIDNPSSAGYFAPIDELELPDFGFQENVEYLKARQARMKEIVGMMDAAVRDDSVQQYKVFADDPLYQNTNYGMYFTTIYDALTFSQEALKIIGLLHESAVDGAIWLDYGYITDSGDVRMDFDDYVDTQLLFNGLLGQMQEYGYLEEAVGYAAGVLGSQMQDQSGYNNIFQAHEQIGVAGDSMQRAQGYFQVSDVAEASGNQALAQQLDFLGMMNMAEGLYSLGESYKLKEMVLLMLIDGTFKDGIGLKRKLGSPPGSPCTKDYPKMCPTTALPPTQQDIERCCPANCPPGYYIQDMSSACWGGITQGPGGFPTPGGAPGPSLVGGAVANVAREDTEGLFPIFQFDREKAIEKINMLGWPNPEIPKYPEVPDDFRPADALLVKENIRSAGLAMGALALINVPEASVKPAEIKFNGKPVAVVPEERQVAVLDEYGRKITGISTSTPQSDAINLKMHPEDYAKELEAAGLQASPAAVYLGSTPVEISPDGYLIDAGTGERLRYLGADAGFGYDQLQLANKRLGLLGRIVEYEDDGIALSGSDAWDYVSAKRDELLILLEAINRQYQFELANIKAKDISFEEQNDIISVLYARVNQGMIRAVEGSITDARVRKFILVYPEQDAVLAALLEKRGRTADYYEITGINKEILDVMYDTGIADYYAGLKAQNRPFDID